jgi:lysine 2,3-aminomutase
MYKDISDKQRNNHSDPEALDRQISETSQSLLSKILDENQMLKEILGNSHDFHEFKIHIRNWVSDYLKENPNASDYYEESTGRKGYDLLSWKDMAAIRFMDYLDHEGMEYEDLNLNGQFIINRPFKLLWLALTESKGGANEDFFRDMLHLFRQFSGNSNRHIPRPDEVKEWMDRHPSGMDPEVIEHRKKNRDRIIRLFIKKIDAGDISRRKFTFDPEMTYWQKYKRVLEWWNDRLFHLQFAARTPERLNRMLGQTLEQDTMNTYCLMRRIRGYPFL